MKKETTNTFEGGMIKDLHPLTTPSNVLTDALNATFITYNGNESILQNDMGNVKVQQALLKSGYVPVGMKEHGGIIYVAAYNPETHKGQVGSFPSPKQLWEDENWSVNAPADLTYDPSFSPGMYNGNFIVLETVRHELFSTAEGPRIFHPGDKFIVGLGQKSSLSTYVNKGYISIQLGVVKSDGGIEIMKTWSKDSPDNSFIYDSDGNLKSLLSNRNIVQVFDASSSGSMLLIVNLHTLDSFNLLRSYSLDGDQIKVTFTGEGQKDGETYTSTSDDYLKLYDAVNDADNNKIEISGTSGTVSRTIYPNVPFGIIQRMGREVKINFDRIRGSEDRFGEWRFFVTEKYVKIGWAYDFYNLDNSKELKYIRMYFHLLENGYTSPNASGRGEVPYVTFQRDNYNGNFEDYINYDDVKIKYRNIYIVEIVKNFGDNVSDEEIIGFRMLYLSKLYNSQYNGFYENKSIGGFAQDESDDDIQYKSIPNQPIHVDFDYSVQSELSESKTQLIKPDTQRSDQDTQQFEEEFDTSNLRQSMYATPVSAINKEDLEANPIKYQYLTRIKNKYNGVLKITGKLSDLDSDLYIGVPKEGIINDVLNQYRVSELKLKISKEWVKSTELPGIFVDPDNTNQWDSDAQYGQNVTGEVSLSTPNITVNDGQLLTDSFEFSDCRLLQGRVSGIQSNSYTSKGLRPLYAPSYNAERKNKIAPYWNQEEARCLSGAGEDEYGICYNTSLAKGGYTVEGPNAGGGADDGGLYTASNYMGNPMTNIFSGEHGEEAELCFENTSRNWTQSSDESSSLHCWNGWNMLKEGGEKGGLFLNKQSDNYLVACWKFTDGNTHFVNLMTPRMPRVNMTQEDFLKSTTKWPRLDVIMRCLLSQIFVVNRITLSYEYVTTDERFYRYQEGTNQLLVDLSTSTNKVEDVMVSENREGNTTLTQYLYDLWGYNGSSINVNGGSYSMQNLIPIVVVSLKSNEQKTIDLQNFYDMDSLVVNYFGTEYRKDTSGDDSLDPKVIYKIDTSSNDNASFCSKQLNGKPSPHMDGTFEWIDTPNCKPISSSDTSLEIYRWDDSSIIRFNDFFSHFVTKGKLEDWVDVPEGEDNDIYAKGSTYNCGYWTNADNEDAPDLYGNVLFSPQISPIGI